MKKKEKDKEVKLFEEVKKGNIKAMEEFHKLFRQQVFDSAFTLVRNEEDVKDITQKVFIRVWERREKIVMTHPRTYLSKTARNMALNFLQGQKNNRLKHLQASIHLDATQVPHEYEIAPPLEEVSREELLMEAIAKMPKKQAHIFTEVKINGKKRKVVADSEKVKLTTVDSHLRGAAEFLKVFFKK